MDNLMVHCFVMRHKRAEKGFREIIAVKDYVTNLDRESETSITAQAMEFSHDASVAKAIETKYSLM